MPAVLVLVGIRLGSVADADLTAVDVQFPDDGRAVEFPPHRVVGKPEPTEANQQVVLEILDTDKVFRAAGNLVGHHIEVGTLGGSVAMADLPTADAVTRPAVVFEALASELPEIRLPDAALDVIGWNVSLDALEARVGRDDRLDLGDQFRGLVVVQWVEFALVPAVVDSSPLDDQRRVDFQKIRPPLRALEDAPEILQTHLL